MKKAMKSLLTLILCLLLTCGLAACGGGGQGDNSGGQEGDGGAGGAAPAEPVILKFSDVNAANSPAGVFCENFKSLVEERTEGRVKIEIHYGGTLTGNDIEGTQTGIADLSQHDVSEITDLCKLLSILEAPYLYDNDEQLYQVTAPDSEIMSVINEELAGSGVQLLTTYSWGNQQLLTVNQPVFSEADLKGQKIRVLPSDIFMKSMEAMGGTATPMSWGEVITSLVTNMIEGTGLPFGYIVDTGMQEIINYVIMTDHNPTLSGIFINEDSWARLSAGDQEILKQAGAEARVKVSENIAESNAANRKIIEEAGVTIIEKDELSFDFDAIRDQVFEEFKGDWGDNYQKILDILGK